MVGAQQRIDPGLVLLEDLIDAVAQCGVIAAHSHGDVVGHRQAAPSNCGSTGSRRSGDAGAAARSSRPAGPHTRATSIVAAAPPLLTIAGRRIGAVRSCHRACSRARYRSCRAARAPAPAVCWWRRCRSSARRWTAISAARRPASARQAAASARVTKHRSSGNTDAW